MYKGIIYRLFVFTGNHSEKGFLCGHPLPVVFCNNDAQVRLVSASRGCTDVANADILQGGVPFVHTQQVFAMTKPGGVAPNNHCRSEEHTSELQSLMRISYAVFCLQTKNHK